MWQDWINATFELMGGFFVACHCWRTYHDKGAKGVSLFAAAGFSIWGFWNLYYYPCLSQWASLIGTLGVTAANCLWICLIIYYRRNNFCEEKHNARHSDIRTTQRDS